MNRCSGPLKTLAVLVLALGFLTPPAPADISEAAEREAAEKAYEEAGRLLEATYKKAMSILLEDDERTLLREEHKAWEKWRDQRAELEAAPVKGSNYYNMVRHDALRRLTIERYAALLNLYYDSYAVDLYQDRLDGAEEE